MAAVQSDSLVTTCLSQLQNSGFGIYRQYGCNTYIHTCMHAYIHTYIHPYIHPYIHTSIHPYIHTSIHPYIHTSIHTYIHTYIYIHIYDNIYIYIYIYTYILVDMVATTPTLGRSLHSYFLLSPTSYCYHGGRSPEVGSRDILGNVGEWAVGQLGQLGQLARS